MKKLSHQTSGHAFLIGRPYDCVGTPVALYNSVFSDFVKDYNNENLPMNEENYRWTNEIIKLMAGFYAIEDDREKQLHHQLRKLFGQEVTKPQLEDKTSNDGVLTLNYYTHNLLYLLMKLALVDVIQLLRRLFHMQSIIPKISMIYYSKAATCHASS
jgi:hypothetical protein